MAVLFILMANLPLFQLFTISDTKSGKILFSNKASEFYISFIHSVNKTPVKEFYKIDGNEFLVYKTEFYSYGAGMPDSPDYHLTVEDGLVTISDLDIRLSDFSVFVGTIADHKIHFPDISYSLAEFTAPQTSLSFRVERISIINYIMSKK